MLWMLGIGVGSIGLIALITHVIARQPRSAPAPHVTHIEQQVNVTVHPLYPCDYDFCEDCEDLSETDPDPRVIEHLKELAHRLAELESSRSASHSASSVASELRRLEFGRYLVETGRLSEDL